MVSLLKKIIIAIIALLLAALNLLKGQVVQLDIPMVFVEGGSFDMGSNRGGADEQPIHTVFLPDFYISKYEVTESQWDAVMKNDTNICYFEGCLDCPVERVSWNGIQVYLQKLNEITGMNYRLPTEAEWEYAARGGKLSKGYKYSGSNKADSVAWTDGNSYNMVHPVGKKTPNELGIYDMSGNVFEWCSDWYSQDYYSISPKEDPAGPETGEKKVMRGGSWFFDRAGIRVADRDCANPDYRYGYVGFRLCLSTNEK
jgi:formylglycine-generating enzyme required for sulfatase activity